MDGKLEKVGEVLFLKSKEWYEVKLNVLLSFGVLHNSVVSLS